MVPGDEERIESPEDQEIAAAIAVAILYFHFLGQSQLGRTLQEGRGAWWTSNQNSARQSRPPRINRSAKQ
jgi:hypothetical protein